MDIFGIVYALLKALPIIDAWFRAFFKWYAIKEREWYEAELHKAIQKAISTGETGDLEDAIKSPRRGKPSGDPDSVFDDPNVP